MDTVKIRNTSTHVKVLSWTERLPPVPSVLRPEHHDVLRGHYGDHLVSGKVVIAPGQVGEVRRDIWEMLLAPDQIVGTWVATGALELLEG